MKKYITDYEQFEREYTYPRDDLGAVTEGDITRFKVWAPFCSAVYLNLYTGGDGKNKIETLVMRRIENGVWYVELMHTCYGMYYTYTLEYEHTQLIETIDPYAKACGINGERGYIADFKALDPEGWDEVQRPNCESPVDAVIYECHVRDFSISEQSGVSAGRRGQFSAFAEEGTKCGDVSTCLDHLKELGVTHVQLMPVTKCATINEKAPFSGQYNWGYDPKGYMCLEGYYSSDAEEGEVRVRDFKQLVMALHKAGIGVVMDVVFNHTYYTEESPFHKCVPYYFHRLGKDGKFSNGSGCGNETASERTMYRKYMLDAIRFWATEYKIDGFRFDLMAIHDIETVNMIRDMLDSIDPRILMYGEGWTGGECAYPSDKLAYKWNSHSFGRVGLFNDNIRDGIKGGTFDAHAKGLVSGNDHALTAVKRGITANSRYGALSGKADDLCWAYTPAQAINYCEAHDNHTLWDKLSISAADFTDEQRRRMDKLAAAMVLLSQGVPFLQLGQDFLRTKPKLLPEGEEPNGVNIFDENSYNAPDHTNMIRWEQKAENIDVFLWYKALIALRRSSRLFRLRSCEEMDRHLHFHDNNDIIVFELVNDEECYLVAFNHRTDERTVTLPQGVFYKRLGEDGRPDYTRVEGSAKVAGISCAVFKRL